jgi:hypothetical protein
MNIILPTYEIGDCFKTVLGKKLVIIIGFKTDGYQFYYPSTQSNSYLSVGIGYKFHTDIFRELKRIK